MNIPKGYYSKELYDKIGKFYRTFFPGNGAALKFKGSDKLYTLKSIKTADPRIIFCTDRQTQLGEFAKDITKLETINGKPVVFDWNITLNEMKDKLIEKLEALTGKKVILENMYGTTPTKLEPGKVYQWTGGAEILDITYIGKADKHPEIKPGVSIGKGYIFQWNDQKYFELSFVSIQKNVIEKEEESLEEGSVDKVQLALELVPPTWIEQWRERIVNGELPTEDFLYEIHETLNDCDRDQQLSKTYDGLAAIAKQLYSYLKANPTSELEEASTVEVGNYSTADMEAFLKGLVKVLGSVQIDVRVPSNYPASTIANTTDKMLQAWEQAKRIYDNDPTCAWYVWTASVGGSLNKPKEIKAQRLDINSILDIATKYPDSVRGFAIGVTSDYTKKLDRNMNTIGD